MPPTGPDSIMFTGFIAAVSGDMMPPLDCMIIRLSLKPFSIRRPFRVRIYWLTFGPT